MYYFSFFHRIICSIIEVLYFEVLCKLIFPIEGKLTFSFDHSDSYKSN